MNDMLQMTQPENDAPTIQSPDKLEKYLMNEKSHRRITGTAIRHTRIVSSVITTSDMEAAEAISNASRVGKVT